MFILRARGFPAAGKAAEYGAATAEWVKQAQAQGYAVSLARQYFGAEGESCFVVTVKFKDLAEVEKGMHQIEASPEFRAYVSKAIGTRAAPKYELLEILIPFPQ